MSMNFHSFPFLSLRLTHPNPKTNTIFLAKKPWMERLFKSSLKSIRQGDTPQQPKKVTSEWNWNGKHWIEMEKHSNRNEMGIWIQIEIKWKQKNAIRRKYQSTTIKKGNERKWNGDENEIERKGTEQNKSNQEPASVNYHQYIINCCKMIPLNNSRKGREGFTIHYPTSAPCCLEVVHGEIE